MKEFAISYDANNWRVCVVAKNRLPSGVRWTTIVAIADLDRDCVCPDDSLYPVATIQVCGHLYCLAHCMKESLALQ